MKIDKIIKNFIFISSLKDSDKFWNANENYSGYSFQVCFKDYWSMGCQGDISNPKLIKEWYESQKEYWNIEYLNERMNND